MAKNFLERQNEPIKPIQFAKDRESTAISPITFMDQNLNSRFQYAILKTTENGRYVKGNMLWYSLNGIEIYTPINNIIFVDEANKVLFIRDNDSVVNEISPENPESKQYIVLYTDLYFDEYESETPLRWESYIGRLNAYEAIKTNLAITNIDKSIVLVDNVPLKDALTIREFIEYLVNAEIVEDEIDLNEYTV